MSGAEDRIHRAMRAVERRVAAAAGTEAPRPDERVRMRLNEETARLLFAGTGIPSAEALQALRATAGLNMASAAIFSFWLGYELARDDAA